MCGDGVRRDGSLQAWDFAAVASDALSKATYLLLHYSNSGSVLLAWVTVCPPPPFSPPGPFTVPNNSMQSSCGGYFCLIYPPSGISVSIKVVDGAFNEVNLLKPGEHLVEVYLKAQDYTAAASKEPTASFQPLLY